MTPGSQPDPPNSKEAYEERQLKSIAARWDAKAEQWERDLQDPSCHLNEDRAYARFLEELIRLVEARRSFCTRHGVIDAGCATGLVLATVISRFAWGIGVDISSEMIRIAQAKKIPNTTFLVGDCFKLSQACPKAGAVLSRGVLLSHYGHRHAESLLQSARSTLAPGGFILWDFLNQSSRVNYQHAPENKTFYKPAEVCALAFGAGFSTAMTLGEPDRRVRLLWAETEEKESQIAQPLAPEVLF